MTAEQERKELLANWKKLPENKPSWETWKRMVATYHSERHAWYMCTGERNWPFTKESK